LLQERLKIDLFELKVLKARVFRESTAIVSSRDDFKPFIFSFRKPGTENHGRVLEEKKKKKNLTLKIVFGRDDFKKK
jgi:hypothetical protein